MWSYNNPDPNPDYELEGTIDPGEFFIVCNNADTFNEVYGLTCDYEMGYNSPADSDGNDNIALVLGGEVVDMFGVPGEAGYDNEHEFLDGRAERAIGNITASATWNAAGWNVDSGGGAGNGDGPQYAPEDFDPGAWIGTCADGEEYDECGICDGPGLNEDGCCGDSVPCGGITY